MIRTATELRKITEGYGIPLIINDRADVALAVDADGVHVGQEDMPAGITRRIIGRKKLLGVSVKTVGEALRAIKDGADYLGVGDIFGTVSKKDAGVPIGLEMVKKNSGMRDDSCCGYRRNREGECRKRDRERRAWNSRYFGNCRGTRQRLYSC